MPGLRYLSDLVTQVRRRADMVNTQFVSDEEVEQYIQDSWGEYYDLVIESGGEAHFVTTSIPITTSPGVATYTVFEGGPGSGVYGLFDGGLLLIEGGTGSDGNTEILDPTPYVGTSAAAKIYKTTMVTLRDGRIVTELQPSTAAWKGWAHRSSGITGKPRQYIVSGPQYYNNAYPGNTLMGYRALIIHPVPDKAYEILVQYIPEPPDLASAGAPYDTLPAISGLSGWDEYVVVDAAMKCLEKEESPTGHLQTRKLQLIERIRHHAGTMAHRDGDGIINIYDGHAIEDYLPLETA
jgi:hypothetical protein